MKLHIPELGTKLILSAPWSFQVYPEGRNAGMLVATGLSRFFSVDHAPGFGENPTKPPDEVRDEAQARARLEKTLCDTGRGSWSHNLIRWRGEPLNTILARGRYSHVGDKPLSEAFTLPRGAVVVVDRVYIRKGKSLFSSLTFKLEKKSVPGLGKRGILRFWVKLACANTLEFTLA